MVSVMDGPPDIARDPAPVAVASRSLSQHPVLREELLRRCERVTFNDTGEILHGASLVRFLKGHAKAIIGLERLTAAVIAALPDLRVVSKYGVGLDMFDHEALKRHGVALTWTPGVNRRSVAELTLAFMIALMHRVPEAVNQVRSGSWRQITGRQLTGRTIGIVGCGNVGKDVVRLLRPFECRMLAHDIVDDAEFYRECDVAPVALEELLRTSDIVSLHVPLDDSTRNLLDAEKLAWMRPDAVLINTARGGIVDETALGARLESGRIAGAAFDVLAVEPPADWALVRLPTVVVTPHIGGSTEEAMLAMGRAAIAGLWAA